MGRGHTYARKTSKMVGEVGVVSNAHPVGQKSLVARAPARLDLLQDKPRSFFESTTATDRRKKGARSDAEGTPKFLVSCNK